jgi:DNA-binding Xre family transcriptional regulator
MEIHPIYKKMQSLMKDKKVGTREICRAIGVTTSGYYYMIKQHTMTIKTLERICTYMKIHLSDLCASPETDVNMDEFDEQFYDQDHVLKEKLIHMSMKLERMEKEVERLKPDSQKKVNTGS